MYFGGVAELLRTLGETSPNNICIEERTNQQNAQINFGLID